MNTGYCLSRSITISALSAICTVSQSMYENEPSIGLETLMLTGCLSGELLITVIFALFAVYEQINNYEKIMR